MRTRFHQHSPARIVARLALFAAFGALVLAAAAGAGGPGAWTTLAGGQDLVGAASEIGLARTPDGVLHVAWKQNVGASSVAIRTSAITASGSVGPAATAVANLPLPSDPALVAADGGLRLFFAAGAGSPVEGLATATGSASGSSWSAPARIVNAAGGEGTPGVTTAPDGTSFQTWAGSSIAVHRGLGATAPSLLPSSPGATDARPNVTADATGAVWVVWCRFGGSGVQGSMAQRIDPATGAAAGSPLQLPGSSTQYQGKPNSTCVLDATISRREPMAARVGGGVYAAGTSGYPRLSRVLVWRLDDGGVTRTLVAARTTRPAQLGYSNPALAAAPDGRIWVAWLDKSPQGTRIVARRSNRAGTLLGAAISSVPPGGILTGALNLSAQADRVDVLLLQQTKGGAMRLAHTQLRPGLTLVRGRVTRKGKGGAVATLRALDAGDPVAGVRVRLGKRTGTTTARGSTQILVPLTGRKQHLTANATRSGYVGAKVTVVVPARQH
jgi:hypothetical protein